MRVVIGWLRNTKYPIITNFALQLQPWVTRAGKPQLGLLSYLQQQYGTTYDAEHRIFILSDEQAPKFFIYRAMMEDGKYVLRESKYTCHTTKGGDEIIDEFDTTNLVNSHPHLVIIDEAWKFWGSRNWQNTGDAVAFYGAQHGKPGDEAYIVTQHTKQIDPSMYRVAQDFWHCVARGMLRVGLFRRPDDFKVYVFENPPTANRQDPMETHTFKLDAGGIGQCYNTLQGVGLAGGGMLGDKGTGLKKKGLPWWSLPIIGLGFVVLVWMLIHGGLSLAMGKASKGFSAGIQPAASPATNSAVQKQSAGFLDTFLPSRDGGYQGSQLLRSNSVVERRMTGYVMLGRPRVFTSDGMEWKAGDGHLQFLCPNYCVIDGKTNWMIQPMTSDPHYVWNPPVPEVRPMVGAVPGPSVLTVIGEQPTVKYQRELRMGGRTIGNAY